MRFLFLFLGLLLALLPIGVVLAIDSPDFVFLEDVYVFRNVIDTGDQLFFVRYDVSYTVEPDEIPSDAFQMAIYNGTEVLYTRPLNYYQSNIISIYLTSSQALTWQSPYIVRVMGCPTIFDDLVEGLSMASIGLSPGDYKEASVLGAIMLAQAQYLEGDLGETLLTSTGFLNSAGSAYFLKGVPGLGSMDSSIFSAGIAQYPVSRTNWVRSYEANITANAGPNMTAAFTDIGNIFGLSYGWTAFWLGGIGYLLLASVLFASTSNPKLSMMMSVPILFGFAWLGLGTASVWLTIIMVSTLIIAVLFGILFILGKFA